MKKITILATVFLLQYCCFYSTAKAQLVDVFGPFLKKVDGFSAWYTSGQQVTNSNEEKVDRNQPNIERFGFSVKLGPLLLNKCDEGSEECKCDSPKKVFKTKKLIVNKHTIDSLPGKVVELDSTYEIDISSHKCEEAVHLHFGYQYGTGYSYKQSKEFNTSFGLGSIFVSFFKPWKVTSHLSFCVGLSGAFYSLSDVPASYVSSLDTVDLAMKVKSGLTFSPELSLGVGYQLPKWLFPGAAIFVDFNYQILSFSDVTFLPQSDDEVSKSQMKKVGTLLPRDINLSNYSIKIGISLTTGNL